MLSLLLTADYTPFTISFVVMLGIGIIEGVGLGLGHLDLGTDVDVHGGEAGPGLLDWLGLGRDLPILIWLTSLLCCFTVAGFATQQIATMLTGSPLHWGIASGAALAIAGVANAFVSAGLARVFPSYESTVINAGDLLRHRGTVLEGAASRGHPARAKVVDQFGQAHYVMVEPHDDADIIAQGEIAFLVRTMAAIDPDHAVVRSMSAAYWRGGDDSVERVLYRPQYFDKIVAWGGGDAINNVVKYLGPGFQLVSFDPKTSISMIGREAFASDETVELAADLASADVMTLNQEACVASRFLYVEGSETEVDGFCTRLHRRIAERAAASGDVRPLDMELREEVETLMMLDDDYRVWGRTDGRGLVIRSDEPVGFHPINKTANVVRVDRLDDAMRFVNVATQTVGFYPFDRMSDYRDRLASGGAQRIVHLGEAGPSTIGNPHDAMYPMHRFVHWMAHEDGCEAGQRVVDCKTG